MKSCPVGMENGNIKDNQLVASSQWDNRADHGVLNGRLNKQHDSKGVGAWVGGMLFHYS